MLAQVWRRVADNKFELVGESMLVVRPKRYNVYKIQTFEQFLVKPGDLLGFYTTGNGALTYSACNSKEYANRTVYQEETTDLSGVKVSMQKTLSIVAKCRTYSIALTVGAGKGGPLTGGPKCHLSILRNDHVPCYKFCKLPVNPNAPYPLSDSQPCQSYF